MSIEPKKVETLLPEFIDRLVLYPVLFEMTIIIYHNSDLFTPFKPPQRVIVSLSARDGGGDG